MKYMRKDSISINDGTPGGTVELESQVVGNSNYELSKITNTYNGIVQDPNTKKIINWKPGEPKKGIVDFGHKPDRKYSDIFYQEYLPEKWTPQQLRDWYNDPQNYQFEVPINNQGRKFE